MMMVEGIEKSKGLEGGREGMHKLWALKGEILLVVFWLKGGK